jgi:hypothetical protein
MALITYTYLLEMKLNVSLVDENGEVLVDENGEVLVADDWVDVTSDLLPNPNPSWTRGNSGRTIFDRVANIGAFSFGLNNSEANENQTIGYYSPDHGSVVSRFGLDSDIRLTITEGATTHEEWQGKISRIQALAGMYGERKTMITCEDWMANAARDPIRGITVQTSKRDDELLTTLVALAAQPPLATNFSTGDDTYTYALHDENSLTGVLMRVFQKIAMSGLGRIYLTGYETLTYITRSELLIAGAPAATLTDTMTDLQVSRSKAQRVKEVLVTTYPAELDVAAVVLWAARREISLTAGESTEFDISFRDPSGRSTRVAAASIETPVATTDYKFSSTSGSGTDLNSSLGITVAPEADIAHVTLINNHISATGYLWFHQQRGIAVYLYEPVTSYSATGQSDGETLNLDMVYQDDQFVGADISALVTSWYGSDQSDVESVTFWGNSSQELTDAAFLPLGSLVSIYETQTGIASSFIVNGTSKSIVGGRWMQVTWYLSVANQVSGICRLDVVGLAELDDTAILGA